jgi:endonuclease/exonuclease/phosphatase family metal-dependent hydrolase
MSSTSPDSVLFTSYNTHDLFGTSSLRAQQHYREVVAVICGLRPDVLAVQEIRGQPERARHWLRTLAYDTGMKCEIPGDKRSKAVTSLAIGIRGYNSGLLWQPGIEVVSGSFRQTDPEKLWHSAGWATFRYGDRLVRHGTFHATPFDREVRTRENSLLLSLLAEGPDAELPLLIGADWNAESADLVLDEATGKRALYEPGDPFAGVPWQEDMIHQCFFTEEADGARHWVDRSAGQVLLDGGLHDAAAVLRAPWQATTGHDRGDGYGSAGIMRRIDAIRVTEDVVPALRAYRVIDNERARKASDHLPVSVEFVPAHITAVR